MGYCGDYTKLVDVETVKPLSVEDGDPIKPDGAAKRKKWSCCKWTMCILLSLIVFFLASTLLIMTFGYFWTKHQVLRFTTTEGLDLPIQPLPDVELDLFLDRAKLFADTLKAGQVPEQDLTMTVEEMNGFIAHSDCMRGNAFVEVTENKLSADMSIPAEHFPGGKGRFFVASGFVSVQEEEPQDADNYSGEEEDDADKINKAIVTTKLDTHYAVQDMDGPFLSGQFDFFWQQVAEQRRLVVNAISGKFINWIIPEDYIAKKENLAKDICEKDGCHHGHGHSHHHHGHHHHGDHHGHHHHKVHDHDEDDHNNDCTVILNGIERVSIDNGSITVHARRNFEDNSNAIIVTDPAYDGWTDMHGNVRKLVAKLLF